MLPSLKSAWRRLLGLDDTPAVTPESEAAFHLMLGQVPVGVLTFAEGQWQFEYSEAFRARPDLRPLVSFPNKDDVYTAAELWPFFAMRVPSLKQPAIQEQIAREHIDRTDRVSLLRRFGGRTIANPYRLVDATVSTMQQERSKGLATY